MTDEQFSAEKTYQVSRALAKSMFKKGILTADEFAEIDTILLRKYHPLLGILFSQNRLTK